MESEDNTEASVESNDNKLDDWNITNEADTEAKQNNCNIEEYNEIECITESYNKRLAKSEDDIEELIESLLQFDIYMPANSNEKDESNLSSTNTIETDGLKLNVLLEKANQNDEIKYSEGILHSKQEDNFELSYVMNDHNYISQELTAYSKNFNPKIKSIVEIKQGLVSYIVGSTNKSDLSDFKGIDAELDQFMNSLFKNLDAFKFKILSKSCIEFDQQKVILPDKSIDSLSDNSVDGKEFSEPKIERQEALSEIRLQKYLLKIRDSLDGNALTNNKEETQSPSTLGQKDLDLHTRTDEKNSSPDLLAGAKGTEISNFIEETISENTNSTIKHKMTPEPNYLSDMFNRDELNELNLQYSNIQFDSKTLAENCSEPMEYMGVDELSEDFENESHIDEVHMLQQLSAFGSQLVVDCQVFRSSKTSIKDKLLKYISSKYSEYKALFQTLSFLTEISTQTDPTEPILNFSKRNENDKSILLQWTDSESDADIENSECNLQFKLPCELKSNKGKKKHKVNEGNIGLKEVLKFDTTVHPEQEYDDCVSLSKYIQSEIFESEAPSDDDSNAEFDDIDDETISHIAFKKCEKRTPASQAKELEILNESDKENGPNCIRVSHSAEKISKRNSEQSQDEDKDIERLINLNGLEKRQVCSISNKQLDTESYKSKVITGNQKAGKNVLNVISSNETQKELPSDDSMSEQEEETITEKQFLARYNLNLKQQLMNSSSSDSENMSDEFNDDIDGNFSDKNRTESPSVENFLKKFNADKSDFDDDDRSDISNENVENTSSGENTIKSSVVRSKSDNDNDDVKLYNGNNSFEKDKDSSNNSDCEFLNHHFYEKRSRPKSLEKLLSEAEKRKQHNKFEDDLISLSSDSEKSDLEALDTENEPKRVIKPMLRQDQLAGETRKAQKLEADRIRRLEKKQSMLSKMLPDRSEAELILDYNSQTKTFIKVHPGLVKLLKPHQVEGVRFMYDSCYGGVDTLKKTSGSGCILAHCMGLGKTLQLIALLHTVISHKELKTTKILVLCPKSTVMNWADEIQRWLGPINTKNLKLYTFTDTSDINEKLNTIKEWSFSTHNKAGCLLIGYEAFRTLVFFHSYKSRGNSPTRLEEIRENVNKYLLKPGADLVVCDEGHIIKNRKSAISLAVAEIITPKRIILTGTPIQNNLKEYYSMVNFIKPLFLGTEKEFANLYANPIRNGQHKDSSKRDIKVMKQRSFVLHKKLSKFVQRKEAELLKSFLPQKYEYVLFIPMTEVQNNLYEFILDAISKREDNRGRSLITDYTCLRKIWTHPKVLEDAWKNATASKFKKDARKHVLHSDEDEPDDIYDSRTGVMSVTHDWWRHLITDNDLETILPSKKIRTMFEVLRMCEENGEKCLIFSAFVAVLNVVEYFLKKINDRDPKTLSELNITHSLNKNRNTWVVGVDYYRLDGKTPKSIRHEMIKNFNSTQNKRARVFLISARAGGQGINLIGANRVIILDTSWNPSNDQQNIFRIFRLGQKKNCYVYRLLAMGTMEEKVYSRSVTKQAMSFRVVDEQQIDRHYSMAELAELYTLTKPNYGVRPMPIFPQDNILANLLLNFPDLVYKYHEHDSLLENKVEQELSEQEKADAWASYERDLQFNSEIRDMPVVDGLANNFSPQQIQNYFNSFQGSNVNSMFNWNMGHQISSTSLLQTMSQYNYPNASQQYLEMLNILRKMSPSVMVYPELNKSITDDAFNAYNLQKTAATSTALSHSASSAVLSGLPTTTNPLSALGDLSLYGVNPLKGQQRNNNAYCTPTFTNAPLSSQPYVSSPNSIMTTLEQYKPMSTLDNAIHSGNRSQVTKNLPTSSPNLTSIAIQNNSNSSKSHRLPQKSPLISDEQVNRKTTQIPNETLGILSTVLPKEDKKKQDAPIKSVGSTARSNPPVSTVNNPTKSTSIWNTSYTQNKAVKLQSMTSSTNDSSRASNVGIIYPSTKSISNTVTPIQLPSTNMGIVYPSKEKSQPVRSSEMQIMPSPNTSEPTGNPKEFSEISPSISLTAVRGNVNSKTAGNTSVGKNISNYQKPNFVNFNKKEQNIPQQKLNVKNQQTNPNSTEQFTTAIKVPQTKPSAHIQTKSYTGNLAPGGSNLGPNISPFSISNDINRSKAKHLSPSNAFQPSQAQSTIKKKLVKIQPNTTKPSTGNNLSEARNKPVTPITSAIELKKRVEINSSNLSAVKHALNIRQVENKKNPTGAGLFIIEASVNEKKVAIGTPTKSGGGTTITKVTVPDKRKVLDNISKDDPAHNSKRQKTTNARIYDF